MAFLPVSLSLSLSLPTAAVLRPARACLLRGPADPRVVHLGLHSTKSTELDWRGDERRPCTGTAPGKGQGEREGAQGGAARRPSTAAARRPGRRSPPADARARSLTLSVASLPAAVVCASAVGESRLTQLDLPFLLLTPPPFPPFLRCRRRRPPPSHPKKRHRPDEKGKGKTDRQQKSSQPP
jgi:hypothetical protein